MITFCYYNSILAKNTNYLQKGRNKYDKLLYAERRGALAAAVHCSHAVGAQTQQSAGRQQSGSDHGYLALLPPCSHSSQLNAPASRCLYIGARRRSVVMRMVTDGRRLRFYSRQPAYSKHIGIRINDSSPNHCKSLMRWATIECVAMLSVMVALPCVLQTPNCCGNMRQCSLLWQQGSLGSSLNYIARPLKPPLWQKNLALIYDTSRANFMWK